MVAGLLQEAAVEDFACFAEVVLPGDFGSVVFQAIADFLQGIAGHVWAAIAGAGFAAGGHDSRYGYECVLWCGFLERVDHGGFSGDEERRGLLSLHDELSHFFGAADDIGDFEDVLGTLGVCHDEAAGVLFADADEVLDAEDFVDHAGAGPQDHASSGDFHEVSSEVLVGDEQDFFVRRDAIDDFAGISAGDDPVDEAFDGS